MIPGIKLMTPHPMYDPDGTLWNIALAMGPTKDGISTSGWRYVVYKVSCLTYMQYISILLPTCLQDWFSRCPLQTLLSQRLTRGSTWKSSLKWLQQDLKGFPTFTGETFLLYKQIHLELFFSQFLHDRELSYLHWAALGDWGFCKSPRKTYNPGFRVSLWLSFSFTSLLISESLHCFKEMISNEFRSQSY